MKSSLQVSLLQKPENFFQNNIIFEKKSDFGRNGFILRRQKYPDFRFACPNWGTLDVLLELKHYDMIKGHCLECKIEWDEDSKQ